MAIPHQMTTTQFELDGYQITRSMGIVRGIIVRSRSLIGTIGAGLQTLVGGNITLLTELCEKTRADSFSSSCAALTDISASSLNINLRWRAQYSAQLCGNDSSKILQSNFFPCS